MDEFRSPHTIELLDLSFQAAPTAMLVVDSDGRIAMANPQCTEIFGYLADELIGAQIELLVPEPDRNDHVKLRRRFFLEPRRQKMGTGREVCGIRKDGASVPLEVGLSPVLTAEGTHVLVTLIDITERKRAESVHRRTERRLAEAQRIAKIGSWEWEVETDRVWWSDEAYRMFGLDPAVTTPSHGTFLSLVHPDDRRMVEAQIARVASGQPNFAHDLRIVRPDGRIMWIYATALPTYDAHGKLVRLEGTNQDVTDQRFSERRLRERQNLLDAIGRAQSEFISDGNGQKIFDGLLHDLLELTASEQGVLGEVIGDAAGKPVFNALARVHSSKSADGGNGERIPGPDLGDLDVLFGPLLLTGEPILRNDLDPSVGTTAGTADVRTLMGLPILHAGQLVGVVGVANRPGGYQHDWVDFVQPLLATCGALIDARRVQAMRWEAEEEVRRFFSVSLDMLCIAGVDGYFKRINPAWEKCLGWSEEELLSRPYLDFVHEDDLGKTRVEAAAVGTTGNLTLDFENRYRCKDGTYRWLSWKAFKLSERSVIYASAKDVTEQKRAQAALADASAHLEAVLDAATETSIIAADPSGVIQVFNSGAERMLGYCAAEVVGKHTPALIHVEQEVVAHSRRLHERFGIRAEGFEALVAHARRGGHEEREWTYVRKGGTRLTVSLTVTAIRDALGAIIGFLGVAKDVTAARRAQKELRLAKEAAEAANRAKSEFLANMSHEIRTPMNGILGMTKLVLDADLPAPGREYVELAHRSAECLLEIIDDILDFSKIEAGKLVLDAIPFSVGDLVGAIAKEMTLRAEDKGLVFESRLDADIPRMLVGDPGRLRQILLNLASNAIKFTDAGTVAMSVSRLPSEGDSVRLRFEVRDTGIGIAVEKLDRIFHAFEQADNSTTRARGGTGLGLTISSRLVALMGGSLHVESKVGVGSAFRFDAAFRLSGRDSMHSREERLRSASTFSDAAPAQPRVGGRPLRVLLAEDNLINQKVATGLLAKAGMQTKIANNGREAVALWEADQFDVILMDVQMPEMDGFDATRAIRRRETGSRIPIIALTAHAMTGDRERCLAAGMDDYVPKPVSFPKLVTAIEQALEAQNGREGSAASRVERCGAFDRATLLDRLGGNADLLREILEMFPAESDRMLAELRDGLARNDAAAIRRTAHGLKGALGNLNAADATRAAAELEQLGAFGDAAGCEGALERLRTQIDVLRTEIATALRTDAAPTVSASVPCP